MKPKVLIGRILYNLIGVHMPLSDARFHFGSKRLRALCGKLILTRCGDNVNIEKGARFSMDTELGNNSGIGVNAFMTGKVIIGDNVMMGPECMIFTINHQFGQLDIPMCRQGFCEAKPVVIGAGSVVTHDVEPYSIVGGNPAKLIRYRK